MLSNKNKFIRKIFNLSKLCFLKIIWMILIPLTRIKISLSKSQFYITCIRDDGGGAQIHGRISTQIFSESVGASFSNTKMESIHFGDGPAWLHNWNNLIKFPSNTQTDLKASETLVASTALIACLKILLFTQFMGKNRYVIQMVHAHDYTNVQKKLLMTWRLDARKSYKPSRKSVSNEIIIHLRRGADSNSFKSARYTDNKELMRVVNSLRAAHKEVPIRIFTNQSDQDLEALLGDLAILDSTTNVFDAFNSMANAKVLVMAKSSLSYVAAMLCEGTVYYEKFWHPPMKDWIPLSKLGVSKVS